jgi:membrane protease YdiL (CAAX protease family)
VDSDPPEAQARPLSFLAAAFWTLLVAVLLGVMISVIDAARPGAFVDVVTVATCKVLAYSVVLFALLRVHEPESSIRHLLALRRPPAALVFLGALVGCGLSPAAMWLDALFARRFPPSVSELEAYERIFDAPTPGKKIAILLALVVVMPVCDELFFRGALFTPLKRGRRAESVVLATAAYDTLLGGASARELASILVTVLAISWMRAVSGSVFPSIAARVVFFGVQVVPLVVAREPRISGTVALSGVGLAALSLAGIAAVGKRSVRARDARTEDG